MTPRTVAAALTVVSAVDPSDTTHLATSSPAIPGTHPDRLPTRTICGQLAAQQLPGQPVWEVDCTICLTGSTPYWQMPSWA